jgi:hypothetical protein
MMLERETGPAENPFLSMICFVSLRAMMKRLSEQAEARAESGTESNEASQ